MTRKTKTQTFLCFKRRIAILIVIRLEKPKTKTFSCFKVVISSLITFFIYLMMKKTMCETYCSSVLWVKSRKWRYGAPVVFIDFWDTFPFEKLTLHRIYHFTLFGAVCYETKLRVKITFPDPDFSVEYSLE